MLSKIEGHHFAWKRMALKQRFYWTTIFLLVEVGIFNKRNLFLAKPKAITVFATTMAFGKGFA